MLCSVFFCYVMRWKAEGKLYFNSSYLFRFFLSHFVLDDLPVLLSFFSLLPLLASPLLLLFFIFYFFHSRMISASEQICRRLICWQELCSDVSPCTPCRCSTRLKTLKVSSRETPLQLRKHSSCCWVFFSSWCSLDQWGSWRINVFSPGSPL